MWGKLKAWFKHSETILWARLQAFLGLVAVVLTYVDPSVIQPIFGANAEGFAYFLVANGLATEFLRRLRDKDMNAK